jgi:hypothetical protein
MLIVLDLSKLIFIVIGPNIVFFWHTHTKGAFVSRKVVSRVSRKVVSGKPLSKLSCVCFPLGNLVNGKYFPVKGKFGLISRKVFSFYFGRKTICRSCEKFKNIILFADYIKFGPQTFDCYIFCLNLFFFKFIP